MLRRTKAFISPVLFYCLFCFHIVVHAQTVIRGPYLQQATPTDIVIKWRTDVATDSTVNFGKVVTNLDQSITSPGVATEHEVKLTDLQADTRYYYEVGSSSSVLSGGDKSFSFRTAPLSGTRKPIRIWVVGDSGRANDAARSVRDAYKSYTGARATDLWLMLGDNAYTHGTDSQYQAAVFDMYPEILRQTVLWPSFGNHDGLSADASNESGPYYDIFTLPRNAEAGGLASGTEAYYSFDSGNIHFVALESTETNRSANGAMMTWLKNDLSATNQEWIIAFWHHPPYSKGSHNSDAENALIEMRENALPILESHGVDLVLAGHSHAYERSYLVNSHYGNSDTFDSSMILDNGDGQVDGNGAYQQTPQGKGTVYVVAGSAGSAHSSGGLDHPVMYSSLLSLGSLVLDVDGGLLEAKFLDDGGVVRDYFTLTKGTLSGDSEPPTTPTGLREGSVSSDSVSIVWNSTSDNVGVSGYRVYRDGQLAGTATTESYTDTAVQSATTYSYVVTAYDAANNVSSPSQPLEISTRSKGSRAGSIDVRINLGTDDAEERSSGTMYLNSSDLEMVFDYGNQQLGLRFNDVDIPRGATIDRAYIQFSTDEANAGSTELILEGHAIDNASTFASAARDISSRPRGTSAVPWSPEPWTTWEESGVGQRTPELRTIIKEIVDRSGWARGNSLAVLISGLGERTARSFEGNQTAAPLLHVEYSY